MFALQCGQFTARCAISFSTAMWPPHFGQLNLNPSIALLLALPRLQITLCRRLAQGCQAFPIVQTSCLEYLSRPDEVKDLVAEHCDALSVFTDE
jgi:hypothetical protein